jgi:hypothetical protein
MTYTKTANPDEYTLDWEVFDSTGASMDTGTMTPLQFEDDGSGNWVIDAATIALFDGTNNRINIPTSNIDLIFDGTEVTQNSSTSTLSMSADGNRETKRS